MFLEVERRRDGDEVAKVGTGGLTVVAVELSIGTVSVGLGHLDTVRMVETVTRSAGQRGEP